MSYYRQSSVPKISPVNTVIIVINVLVFLYMMLTGNIRSTEYMYNHGASFWPAVIMNHEYYRLLTCAFIHFSFSHLFNNMLVLAFIGDNLERALGKVRYIIFYLACALGSSLVSVLWNMVTGSYAISGGASGAIFGVVGGLLLIIIKNRGRLEDISSVQLGLFAVFTIYHGLTSMGVDNAAHLGGFIIGAVLGLLLYRKKKRNVTYYA